MLKKFLLVVAAASLIGCSQQQLDQASQDAQRAGTTIKEEAGKAGSELKETAKTTGREIKQGAQELSKEAGDQIDAGRVKSVLMASSKLDSSKINVDRIGEKYYLRGSVPTEEQKELAQRLSRDIVAEPTLVVNELQVAQ